MRLTFRTKLTVAKTRQVLMHKSSRDRPSKMSIAHLEFLRDSGSFQLSTATSSGHSSHCHSSRWPLQPSYQGSSQQTAGRKAESWVSPLWGTSWMSYKTFPLVFHWSKTWHTYSCKKTGKYRLYLGAWLPQTNLGSTKLKWKKGCWGQPLAIFAMFQYQISTPIRKLCRDFE